MLNTQMFFKVLSDHLYNEQLPKINEMYQTLKSYNQNKYLTALKSIFSNNISIRIILN